MANQPEGTPDDIKMQCFLRWVQEHGATFCSTIKVDAAARRLHAARECRPGELLMHIPTPLMITEEVAKNSGIGRLLAQHGSWLGTYEYIAAFLLQTKREGGFWKPYVDILPQDLSGHALLLSEFELEQLKGSRLFRMIPERQADNKRYYDRLPPSVKEAYTLDEFTWARCVLITRAFGVRFEGKSTVVLVPLADMFDRSADDNARWFPEALNGFTVTASRPVEAGTTLFGSYRKSANAQLFYTYGVCLDDNSYNDAEILLPPLPDGHRFTEHAQKLGESVAGMRAFKVRRSCADDAASAIFSYLRLTCSDASLRLDAAEVGAAGKVPPISRENEIAALTALAQACARQLREYPTSAEEDDTLLKDPALPRNVRNMIKVRRDEKAILSYFLDLANIALPVLQDESCDLSEHAAAGSPYAGYFAEIGPGFGIRAKSWSGSEQKRGA